MEKTSPQGKQQAMKSTTEEEEEMCDKAGDSSLGGIVNSFAASFKAGDHDHCKEMFLKMSFLNPFPNPGERDPVMHDFLMRRSWSRSSFAEHMPVKLLISPTDFNDDSVWNWDEMMIHPREDAKFLK
jgi:hypothetical protein